MNKNNKGPIPVAIIPNVSPSPDSPRAIAARFRALLESGYSLRVDGQGKKDSMALLKRYTPKYEIELFGSRYFIGNPRIGERKQVAIKISR